MAQLTILYWRDIPSQVIVKAGRSSEKRLLPAVFQEAIDMAAMRSGSAATDDYLEEWRREGPTEVSDDLAKEAEQAERALCDRYDRDRLKLLIANGGWAEPKSERGRPS
ncbi:MAG TPA: virulence factor [Aestuariivirgaceae bacterium]|jgi:Virulence factor|nr:virulence factor [Aestuariivirgaceae bacterium]